MDFERHLRAEKDLADLTIRNYKADLQPLYDYMRLKNIEDMPALDRKNAARLSGMADRTGICAAQRIAQVEHAPHLLEMDVEQGHH